MRNTLLGGISIILLTTLLLSCQRKTVTALTPSPPSTPDISDLQADLEYESEIKAWQSEERAGYVEAFNVFEEKVFTESDFAFYPIDTDYRVMATLTLTPDTEVFEMPTSGTRTPKYRAYGQMTFTLDGTSQTLTLYESMGQYADYLFCPFYDETSGEATYGGGRYMDFLKPTTDKLWVDFNKCYHPYCAYLDKFNCPITPVENTLTVAVESGMRLKGTEGH